MPLSKDIIGSKLDPFSIKIERDHLKEFCAAIGETNPLYTDQEAARAQGYPDTPAPPTFQTSFIWKGYGYERFWDKLKSLGIDTDRLLHTKEEYVYLQPIFPGDEISGSAEIVEVRAGRVEMATLKTTYVNQKGETCLEAVMGIMIRPEGK